MLTRQLLKRSDKAGYDRTSQRRDRTSERLLRSPRAADGEARPGRGRDSSCSARAEPRGAAAATLAQALPGGSDQGRCGGGTEDQRPAELSGSNELFGRRRATEVREVPWHMPPSTIRFMYNNPRSMYDSPELRSSETAEGEYWPKVAYRPVITGIPETV